MLPLVLSTLLLEPPTTYEQAQLDLEQATVSVADVTPEQAIAALQAAIAESIRHGDELRNDVELPERLARARLTLAWAYLAAGDEAMASTTMDIAICSAGARPLPLSGLGPDIRKLHDVRRKQLEAQGTATIVVDCDGCEVVIDEIGASNPSEPLLLGSHRVWLFDPSGALEPRFQDVDLAQPDTPVELVYRPAARRSKSKPEREREPTKPPTRVPRWAKLTAMGVGVGLLVVGGVLLSLDGKCRNGDAATAENLDACPRVWTNAAPGYGLIAAGGGVLLGASVWLSIDEVRANRARATSAMVGWTMRF